MKKILLLTLLLVQFTMFSQDNCENALEVVAGTTYTVDAVNGTPTNLNCLDNTNASNAEWYKYIPSADYSLTVTTDLSQNSGKDTRFHIYSGTCDILICEGGDDDDGDVYLSVDTINVTANTTYYIAFDNRWDSDEFDFLLQESDPLEILISFTTQSISNLGRPYALVDMNGDHLDDVLTVDSNTIDVHYQTTTGFDHQTKTTPTATYSATWSMAAGDLDGNGFNDLLYGNGQGVSFMYTGNDGNTFSEWHAPDYVFSQRSNFVDINNDGNLDAFVCHDVEPSVYYINNGDGTLTYHKSNEPGGLGLADYYSGGNYGSVWIDYDNDRDMDLFIAKCGGSAERSSDQMYRNNGDGTFTEVGSAINLRDSMQTWSSAWADYDNDGDLDVFVGASTGAHKLMSNNGDGTFTNITAGSGFDSFSATSIENICHDFNNDGYVDVFGAGETIMINNGDMTFTPSYVGFGSGAAGDVNNDGFLDYFNGSLHINDGNNNNWIKIVTIGMESNKNGIGARVEIESDLGTQIRDVQSGTGFRHMSTLNTHFGIGQDESIDRVTIYWPSGIVDQIDNPAINQTLSVVEGSAPLSVDSDLIANISIYPNPVENKLTITTTRDLSNSLISIFDIQGRRVVNTKYESNQINVQHLSSGTYFLRIIKDNKETKLKFIKK